MKVNFLMKPIAITVSCNEQYSFTNLCRINSMRISSNVIHQRQFSSKWQQLYSTPCLTPSGQNRLNIAMFFSSNGTKDAYMFFVLGNMYICSLVTLQNLSPEYEINVSFLSTDQDKQTSYLYSLLQTILQAHTALQNRGRELKL